MSEEKIGIKIADGSFFPVLEENSSKKKRLILTTVNDNQSNVQIDLYKGEGEAFRNPSYVGSLMIDSIAPAEKGTPEIELKIGFDGENILSAAAKDLASGTEESLSVSIESLTDDTAYDVPEFSLEDDFDEDEYNELALEEESGETETHDQGSVELENDEPDGVEKRRLHPALVAFLVILSLLVLAALVYFMYNSFAGKEAPVLQAGKKSTLPAAEKKSAPPVVAAVKKETPAPAAAAAPVVSEAKKTAAADTGVWYRIRWGDTLWGISYSFYSSPKLYAKIAKENSIKNPDLIFAETKIFIPKE